ncbi:MAG TPA: XF1762 family protein [Solirubrobacterales bacterium]|nr:XF1762 family protein [Solirubrobacterales bacterium]
MPTTLREANAFVERFHRHSGPARGHKFSVGAALGEELVGVAIAGRPIARHRDDGSTIEVLRVCVAAAAPRNTCSLLYGACWRAARAMGYRQAITYTLRTESGASLRASGFKVIGEVGPHSWDRPSRSRPNSPRPQKRISWEQGA